MSYFPSFKLHKQHHTSVERRPSSVPISSTRRHTYSYSDSKSRLDYVMLVFIALLTLFGLLMVYDASIVQAFQNFGDKNYFIKQQAIWVILGFISLGFFMILDYHILERLSLIAFLGSCFLLLLVFVPGLGVNAYGAHRWLSLGGFTIQPAEIIKMTTIIFFATLFQKHPRITPFLTIVGVITIIIGLFQKDLGSAIIYVLISAGIFFAAGGPMYLFAATLPVGVMGALLFILTSNYRKQRVLAFLDPFADTQGFTYHISQVLIALGSGGIFGVGVGQSRQKFAYIPEVTTDSIFSIIGEEFGFVGSVILISLFGFFIVRGFKIAESAPDGFGKLLASGIVIWIGAQACVNLAAMVSLIPLTGVPLPFISYGGSALLCNLAAVGILLNISRQSRLVRS
jgi:cell division protein FtsW